MRNVLQRPLVSAFKKTMGLAQQEYLLASAYFREIGAQTPSAAYGGSRSFVYQELVQNCTTLGQIRKARADYRSCHAEATSNHDEFGGALRIAGYRLRHVPFLGKKLEDMVRADDKAMAGAAFYYPEGCVRVSAPVEVNLGRSYRRANT